MNIHFFVSMLHEGMHSRRRGGDLIVPYMTKERHPSKMKKCCKIVRESILSMMMRVCATLVMFLRWMKAWSCLRGVDACPFLFVLSMPLVSQPWDACTMV